VWGYLCILILPHFPTPILPYFPTPILPYSHTPTPLHPHTPILRISLGLPDRLWLAGALVNQASQDKE
jgi:hypothetical protein